MKSKKSLSGVALRLAAILIQKLDEYNDLELPSRNELASILGVSRTAIINALAQLEEEGFIVRRFDLEDVFWADDDDKKRELRAEQNKQKKLELLNRKDFSGKFRLNYFYNKEQEEINMSELLEKISDQSLDIVTQALNSYQIEDRLLDIEVRLKKIEDELFKETIAE